MASASCLTYYFDHSLFLIKTCSFFKGCKEGKASAVRTLHGLTLSNPRGIVTYQFKADLHLRLQYG